jgi:amino acid adenylation domain-containing protein
MNAVPVLVYEWVSRRPAECAVRDPARGRSLTYQELWARSGRLAGQLRACGVRRGDRVALAMDRSTDMVVAMLGILRAGAGYLPLDRHSPDERLASIVEQAGVALTVHSVTWRDRLPDTVAKLAMSAQVSVRPFPDVLVDADDCCYVAYTSGSTGVPKGVVVPHRAVVRLVTHASYCPTGPGELVANMANPAFDATTFEIWSTLAAGGTVVVLPQVTETSLDAWTGLLRAEGITTLFLTTSLFHLVARERPAALASLKQVVVGGEQMDLAATRRVLAAGPPKRLVNGYGPTETTTFASWYECTTDNLAGLDRVPIGRALQDTRLYVVDEYLNPVTDGEAGELCVAGSGVAQGYLGQPAMTAEKFVPEPGTSGRMYRTGDLVRRLPGGALELLGRKDRQVKLRGFRIELEEVERAAVATGLVDAAFVDKVGDGPSASLVGSVLSTESTRPRLPEALTAALASRLPGYMIPARWLVLPELPLGPTGKVDRARLAQLAVAGRADTVDVSTVDDESVTALYRVCSDLLGATVRAGDNFLALGGNSLLAVQVCSRIREQTTVDIEPAELLLAETMSELAEKLREQLAVRKGTPWQSPAGLL